MSKAFDEFRAAIQAGGDDKIEAARNKLTAGDVDDLLALASGERSEARWWAIYALVTTTAAPQVERSTRLLIERLADEAADVRAAAALAVAHLFERFPNAAALALAPLAERLRDDDGFVRQTAADSLARCGERSLGLVVGVLRNVLASEHQGARGRAAYALHKLAVHFSPRADDPSETVKSSFDQVVAQLAPPLFAALNDSNYLVHTHAHEALEALGLLDNVLLTR